MKKLQEITWYRIFIGILLLIILVMAFNMNTEVNIDNGNILNKDCFEGSQLSFGCEYTNDGDLIPFKKDGEKHWKCVVNDKILYEVEAC